MPWIKIVGSAWLWWYPNLSIAKRNPSKQGRRHSFRPIKSFLQSTDILFLLWRISSSPFFIHNGRLPPDINHTFLTTIPSEENPTSLTQFRPISVIFFIKERIANKFKPLLWKFVAGKQYSFPPGRQASENLIIVPSNMIRERMKEIDREWPRTVYSHGDRHAICLRPKNQNLLFLVPFTFY